jgi:hypothetical protein
MIFTILLPANILPFCGSNPTRQLSRYLDVVFFSLFASLINHPLVTFPFWVPCHEREGAQIGKEPRKNETISSHSFAVTVSSRPGKIIGFRVGVTRDLCDGKKNDAGSTFLDSAYWTTRTSVGVEFSHRRSSTEGADSNFIEKRVVSSKIWLLKRNMQIDKM